MKILVIRHGESLADILLVHEGRADFELTEKGKSQAGKLAEYVDKNFKVTTVYSSTLKRAKETAEILVDRINSKLIMKDDLMEFNNGKLAGVAYDVADILYPKQDVPISKSVYGMESIMEFHMRADIVLSEILNGTKDDETIAIVSHGGMIKRLYMNFLGVEVETDLSYPTGDTGLHLWEMTRDMRIIHCSNYLCHLQKNGIETF